MPQEYAAQLLRSAFYSIHITVVEERYVWYYGQNILNALTIAVLVCCSHVWAYAIYIEDHPFSLHHTIWWLAQRKQRHVVRFYGSLFIRYSLSCLARWNSAGFIVDISGGLFALCRELNLNIKANLPRGWKLLYRWHDGWHCGPHGSLQLESVYITVALWAINYFLVIKLGVLPCFNVLREPQKWINLYIHGICDTSEHKSFMVWNWNLSLTMYGINPQACGISHLNLEGDKFTFSVFLQSLLIYDLSYKQNWNPAGGFVTWWCVASLI